ncbi:unnamed protein product [Mytilus edulis]|uniref:Uncharacterized protein n=1 Tax=Mytilus edulis TaxID=6550 RepID=A0A8S3QWP4_MYTED|nr:unnamed protein product [Mytilus edulis]
MENLRKRTDIKLLNDQSKARKLISKPIFHAFKIFNDDLVAVHKLKQRLCLNRPIYVGFTILDLSKTLMYNFHYNYMKDKYGSRAKLLFTDTDSLCYNFYTDDIYHDMMEDKHLFDTSEITRIVIMENLKAKVNKWNKKAFCSKNANDKDAQLVFQAIYEGKLRLTRILIEGKVNVNCQDSDGERR